jgi:hypothetical protein
LIGTFRQNNPICSGLVISSPFLSGSGGIQPCPMILVNYRVLEIQVNQASIADRMHIPEIGFSKQHSQAKPIKDAMVSADNLKT